MIEVLSRSRDSSHIFPKIFGSEESLSETLYQTGNGCHWKWNRFERSGEPDADELTIRLLKGC